MQQLSTARAAGRMLCTNPSDTFNDITFSTDQSLFSCYFPPYFHPPRFTSHLPTSKIHPVSASKWLRKGKFHESHTNIPATEHAAPQGPAWTNCAAAKQSSQQQHHGKNVGSKMFQEARAAPGAQHRDRPAGDTRKRTITSEHEFGFSVCCGAGKDHPPGAGLVHGRVLQSEQ